MDKTVTCRHEARNEVCTGVRWQGDKKKAREEKKERRKKWLQLHYKRTPLEIVLMIHIDIFNCPQSECELLWGRLRSLQPSWFLSPHLHILAVTGTNSDCDNKHLFTDWSCYLVLTPSILSGVDRIINDAVVRYAWTSVTCWVFKQDP